MQRFIDPLTTEQNKKKRNFYKKKYYGRNQ